jgi:phosphatidylserine/phosphatidylglycerophosphate/cardiolipin synthase-like enzyme
LGYSFTSDPLAEALIERAQVGVQVSGVFDSDMYKANTGTEYDKLVSVGLSFCLDGESGLMHNKVIVIDEQVVILGSYNFTASAERYNDENVIFLYDREIAQDYLQEVEFIMRQCK